MVLDKFEWPPRWIKVPGVRGSNTWVECHAVFLQIVSSLAEDCAFYHEWLIPNCWCISRALESLNQQYQPYWMIAKSVDMKWRWAIIEYVIHPVALRRKRTSEKLGRCSGLPARQSATMLRTFSGTPLSKGSSGWCNFPLLMRWSISTNKICKHSIATLTKEILTGKLVLVSKIWSSVINKFV